MKTTKTFIEKKLTKIIDKYFPDEIDVGMYHVATPRVVEEVSKLISQALTDQAQEILEMEKLKDEIYDDYTEPNVVHRINGANQLRSQIKAAIREEYLK